MQTTTAGHSAYFDALEEAFPREIDYTQLVKTCGAPRESEARSSVAWLQTAPLEVTRGGPDASHISKSYVERQIPTMLRSIRRSTCRADRFSKKTENHGHAVAIHYMHHNFVKTHKALGTTPAMAAGLSDRVWRLVDIVGLTS